MDVSVRLPVSPCSLRLHACPWCVSASVSPGASLPLSLSLCVPLFVSAPRRACLLSLFVCPCVSVRICRRMPVVSCVCVCLCVCDACEGCVSARRAPSPCSLPLFSTARRHPQTALPVGTGRVSATGRPPTLPSIPASRHTQCHSIEPTCRPASPPTQKFVTETEVPSPAT